MCNIVFSQNELKAMLELSKRYKKKYKGKYDGNIVLEVTNCAIYDFKRVRAQRETDEESINITDYEAI